MGKGSKKPYFFGVSGYLLEEVNVGGGYLREVDLTILSKEVIHGLLVTELLSDGVNVNLGQLVRGLVHDSIGRIWKKANLIIITLVSIFLLCQKSKALITRAAAFVWVQIP